MDDFLLIRNGYFFRPGARGYTASRAEAGRFSEDAARDYCISTEGVTRIKADDAEEVAPVCTHGMIAPPPPVARPEAEWHEDDGPVTWWKFPIEEAPWIGTPLDSDWPGYHTHFTPAPAPPAEPSI